MSGYIYAKLRKIVSPSLPSTHHAIIDLAVAADVALLAARVAGLVGVGAVARQVTAAVTVVAEGLPAAALRLRVGAVAGDVARLVAAVADVLAGGAVTSHVPHSVTLVALLCGGGGGGGCRQLMLQIVGVWGMGYDVYH